MTPRKSEWLELAESDGSTRDVRKIDKRLTFGTLATVSAIILGGSLFANAHDEPIANAEVLATSSPTAASASSTPTSEPTTTAAKAVVSKTPQSPTPAIAATNIKPPAIASMPKGGDDEGDEHEGREGRNKHRDSENDDEEDDD